MYNVLLKACQVVLAMSSLLILSSCGASAAPAATPTASTTVVPRVSTPSPATSPSPTTRPTSTPTITPPAGVTAPTPAVGVATPAGTIVVPPAVTPGTISIEIVGPSPNHTFIAPGQTATIPFTGNPSVLVHFPYLIGSTTSGGFRPYRTEITVDPPLWQVEMGNYPNGNTLSFRLRGDTPGRFTVRINFPETNQVVTFTLEVLPPAGPTGTPSATPQVTLDDNGTTLQLKVGQRFLLALGTGFDWTVTVADPTVVSRVVNVLVVQGAQGIYEAKQPGRTTLTAVGDLPCRKAQPPCAAPSRLFRIDIVVQ